MFSFGVVKHVERTLFVPKQSKLSTIKSSIKNYPPTRFSFHDTGGCGSMKTETEEALLVAHSMFNLIKCAFCDSSVDMDPRDRETGRKIMSRGWKSMCMVVEMELSLMYDLIYTKAAVIHTCLGYIIRIASLLLTITALLMFAFCNQDGLARQDIIITYWLVISTLLLDVRSLLGALGSTWAYTYLKGSKWKLLRDAVCCCCTNGVWHGIWHRLRRLGVSMDLSRLPLYSSYRAPVGTCRSHIKQPSSYRLWLGFMGQFNLFDDYNDDIGYKFWKVWKKLLPYVDTRFENWGEYKYSTGYKISEELNDLLFQRIWEELILEYPPHKEQTEEEKGEALQFDPDELQEVILIWHITTNLFLQGCSFQDEVSQKYEKLTNVLSNYMAFLVVVRPNMLPVLKRASLQEATRKALLELSNRASKSRKRTEEITSALYKKEKASNGDRNHGKDDKNIVLQKSSNILLDGTQYAKELRDSLKEESIIKTTDAMWKRFKNLMPKFDSKLSTKEDRLIFIFDAWVRLLINASNGCTKDSHAKQLGRGGDLITIVWLLTKHASIFGIEETAISSDEESLPL